MKKTLFVVMMFLVGGGFTGCHQKKKETRTASIISVVDSVSESNFTPQIHYAKGFRIQIYADDKLIQLQEEIFQQYCMLELQAQLLAELPKACNVVR